MLEAAVTSAGIANLLHAVISFEKVQVFKPSPRVYQLAAEALKVDVDARDIGFVSAEEPEEERPTRRRQSFARSLRCPH
jgi:2-haloacid dehalogenase